MSKSKSAAVRNPTAEDAPLIPLSDVPKEDRDAYWLTLANDLPTLREIIKPIPFFAILNEFPPALWEKHLMIYMYRLDPEVRNRAGEKKYIQRVTWPIDEEWVKEKHGGGKYELYLKCGDENLKQIIFAIDGPAKLLPGQTLVGQENQPPSPATAGRSEIAEAIEATSQASTAGFEILQKGMDRAMELQSKITEKNLGLAPNQQSNQISDLVALATALKTLQSPVPPRDPLVEKLLETALANLVAKPNPEPARHAELGGQLDLVKDIFGVDSLKDLGTMLKGREPKTEAVPWWAAPLAGLVEKLPALIGQVSEMRQADFQRALLAQQVLHGATPPTLPMRTISPTGQPSPAHPFPPAVGTPASAAMPSNGAAVPTLQQLIDPMVQMIAKGFDRGFNGGDAAAAVDLGYAGALEQFAPMFLDPAAIAQFIVAMPALAERSQKPEWADFQTEFVAYVRETFAAEEETASGAETPEVKIVTAAGAA